MEWSRETPNVQARPRLRAVDFVPWTDNGKPVILARDPLGITERVLVIPRELLFLLSRMDGSRTVLDLQAEISKLEGRIVFREELERLLLTLDEAGFLENDAFRARVKAVEEEFRRSSTRSAYHAGRSYPEDPVELQAWLDDFYRHPQGAGRPNPSGKRRVRALVAPHIDFRLGGPVYSHAYRALGESSGADLFVIFGTGHQGLPDFFSIASKDFETPLGTAQLDRTVYEGLRNRLGDRFQEDFSHRTEHSIEFQLIWLQDLFRTRPFKILPILCSFSHLEMVSPDQAGLAAVRLLAEALHQTVGELGRRVVYVAGVDFSHVGPRYGDPGPTARSLIQQVLAEDLRLFDALLTLNGDEFIRLVDRAGDRRRICGFPALVALLQILPNDARGRLLAHSYAKMDEEGSFVTFASLVFEE